MAAVDTTGYHLASPRFETAQQVMDNARRIERVRLAGRGPEPLPRKPEPTAIQRKVLEYPPQSNIPAILARESDPFIKPRPFPRIDTIQRAVCKHFHLNMSQMLSRRRDARVVRVRHVAMFLAHSLTPHSYPEIGRRFGGMDHTSILHGCRKMKALLPYDLELQSTIEALTKILVPEPVL